MRLKLACYWVSTSLVAAETFSGGVMDLARLRHVVDVVTRLGYPVYLLAILGVWKILGAPVLVLPRFLRLKEWAYAGVVFEISGAAVSQVLRGDGWSDVITPLVILVLTVASWALRPPSRTLAPQAWFRGDPQEMSGRDPAFR